MLTVPAWGAESVTSVTAGRDFSCSLDAESLNDSNVDCWGWKTQVKRVETKLHVRSQRYSFIDAGNKVLCGIQSIDSKVVCSGISAPKNLTATSLSVGRVDVDVDQGEGEACAIGEQSQVVCWGAGPDYEFIKNVPAGLLAKKVSLGAKTACAIKTDDTVICWGQNLLDQSPNTKGSIPSEPVLDLAVGLHHACAIATSDQRLLCWGNNDGFKRVDPPQGAFQTVTASRDSSCATATDSSVQCWGGNEQGQSDVPESVTAVSVLSSGYDYVCVVLADSGRPRCWGNNTFGQATTSGKATKKAREPKLKRSLFLTKATFRGDSGAQFKCLYQPLIKVWTSCKKSYMQDAEFEMMQITPEGYSGPARHVQVDVETEPTLTCGALDWTAVQSGTNGYVIGMCAKGTEIKRSRYVEQTYLNPEKTTGSKWDGGFIGGSFNGCGWITHTFFSPVSPSMAELTGITPSDTSPPSTSGKTGAAPVAKTAAKNPSCRSAGAAYKLTGFASYTNDGAATTSSDDPLADASSKDCFASSPGNCTDASSVYLTKECPLWGNYRPWKAQQTPSDQIRVLPAGYRVKWRYVAKYPSADGKTYVMVRDPGAGRVSEGKGNWGFLSGECLPDPLPYLTPADVAARS